MKGNREIIHPLTLCFSILAVIITCHAWNDDDSSPYQPNLGYRNSKGKTSHSRSHQSGGSTYVTSSSFSSPDSRLLMTSLTKQIEPPSRPKSFWEEPLFRPSFDETVSKNVTAQLGRTVHLNCKIHQLADRTISWVRQRDLHILTVGRYTYTSDQRFSCIHLEGSDDWTLEIKYVRREDAGIYECQASTEPKMSFSTRLNVVAAKAKIPEGDIWAKSGSTVTFNCFITESDFPPSYVFWYHEGTVINYDNQMSMGGKVRIMTEKSPDRTSSRLDITGVKAYDAGKYTCKASHADPVSVSLHVIPLHEANNQQAIHDSPEDVNPATSSFPSSSSSVILLPSTLLTFILLTLMVSMICSKT